MKVKNVGIGNKFYYKQEWYLVTKMDQTFVYSEKIKDDGFKHLLIRSIEVSMVKDETFTKNPDYK